MTKNKVISEISLVLVPQIFFSTGKYFLQKSTAQKKLYAHTDFKKFEGTLVTILYCIYTFI